MTKLHRLNSIRFAILALAAVSLCSCQSGVSSGTRTEVVSAAPAPQAPLPSPAPLASAKPQAGCPCCSAETDYGTFAAEYDKQHPVYPVQQAALRGRGGFSVDDFATSQDPWPKNHPDPVVQQAGHHEPALPPALPPQAWTGAPHDGYTHPTAHPAQYPYGVPAGVGAWAPAGIQRPWPPDEWIFDGGDKRPHVEVAPDWSIYGLQQEDTVAHFDTLDGRTLVEPANRVPLYAPRFAAVRKVYGIEAHHHRTPPLVHDKPEGAVVEREAQLAVDADQYLHMRTNLGVKSPIINRERSGPVTLAVELTPETFVNEFAAYEDLQIIRAGIFDNSEKARLAQMVDAAAVWTEKQAAQVVIDETQALTAVAEAGAQVAVKYELAGKPRLRIVKVADRTEARPGDIVEFTLRFDNIGTQVIGNVTILDNLTTRLEYVPDTAQCSLRANFGVQENFGESLALRWEILDPMEPGEGGVIRFKCRVR
ncbi:MAG: DUF11 domain-containing protein [Planctomycetes bacterium]|nr:DUF11 domain-containing protein [Planctomycetota bacterium]